MPTATTAYWRSCVPSLPACAADRVTDDSVRALGAADDSAHAAALSEWSLYVLETAQGRLYTGISTDVARRLSEHEGGKRGARALRGKGPLTLCYQQVVGDRSRALKLEYRVKQLSVAAKRRLIAGELALDSLLGES
ncbi:MAG: GIY-YIG nuclease family protein [Gammaproteobacteria bacterium]|nr:GIY-YIG nuclease family protein [Gammaproteobacteria bacterium]